MRGVLLDRRWLAGLALAVAVALLCVLLGTWQWQRREARLVRNAAVTTNYDRTPVPLEAVVADPGAPLPASQEWTPVRLRGEYLADDAVLLRQRPLGGRAGYHSLAPFRDDSGQVLLVDRGFVPAGQTGDAPDAVPAPPGGRVEALVRLRPAEPVDGREAPAGQVRSVAPSVVLGAGEGAGADPGNAVTGAYGVLAAEQPAPAVAPVPLPRPTVDEGPHLSYAFQWFVFAAGALVGWGVLVRRAAVDGVGAGGGRTVGRTAAGGARSAVGGHDRGPGPQRRPAGRRRPTAEEEEDALLDAAERRAGRGA